MAASLLDSKIVKGDPQLLALVILKGIKKPKKAPKFIQEMLALEATLDDAKIAAVMTYVRHSFGGLDDTVSSTSVKQWRKDFKKIPRQLQLTQELPRNPSGKILKKELRKPFWEGVGRNIG